MKILLVSNLFPPGFIGGYELAASEVASYLSEKGHDVNVLTSNFFKNDRQIQQFPFSVERNLYYDGSGFLDSFTPSKGMDTNFFNIDQLTRKLVDFRPDVVFAWNTHGIGSVGIASILGLLEIPTLHYLMDNVFSNFNPTKFQGSILENMFYDAIRNKRNYKLLFMSENLKREVSQIISLHDASISILPGWAEKPSAKRLQVENGEKTRFVYASRVDEHKGIHLVVDAASELVRQNQLDFSIDVYGSGNVAIYEQIVHSKKLDTYINFMGSVPQTEMRKLFANYEALLFPTWHREPFGFVPIEAASAGCVPIITTAIGAAEWLQDGQHALHVKRNYKSLASRMQYFMTLPEESVMKLARNGQSLVEKHLNKEIIMGMIESELNNLILNKNTEVKKNPVFHFLAFQFLVSRSLNLEKKHTMSTGVANFMRKIWVRVPRKMKPLMKKAFLRYEPVRYIAKE